MTARSLPPVLAFTLLAAAAPLAARIDYDRPGKLYFQDFNHPALAATGSFPWEDDKTFPGWFAAHYQGARDVHITPRVLLVTEGKGQTHIGFYLYRGTLAPHDAALGGQPTDEMHPGVGVGGLCYAAALVNRTGTPLSRLSLSYRVELWRVVSSASLQTTLVAAYRVGGSTIADGPWTDIPGSAYTPPDSLALAQSANLDGNAPAHVTSFDLSVSDLGLKPGETLWVRWFDVNNRQADLGLGIDDVALALEP
jgi:hypothetical protein